MHPHHTGPKGCDVRVRRLSWGLPFLLLFSAACALAQSTDRHLTSDQAHDLYMHSAYAHGYIHGYESGFHNADMDIHMGRGQRPLKAVKDSQGPKDGYQTEFGDKEYFKEGYKQGFKAGYADSINSRSFRAIDQTSKIASGFGPADSALKGKDFDRAFVAGYESGLTSGANSNENSQFERAGATCQSEAPHRKGARSDVYCDAFMRGFTLGFGDGRAGTLNRSTQTAKK